MRSEEEYVEYYKKLGWKRTPKVQMLVCKKCLKNHGFLRLRGKNNCGKSIGVAARDGCDGDTSC